MIIISDTSPISNLLRIGQLALLQKLYGRVMVPPIVYAEIRALETFGIDISGLSDADWMIVRPVRNQALVASLQTELDPGEAEAIALSSNFRLIVYSLMNVWGDRLPNDLA
jgi:predicted nucleic acid-binding protein